MESEKGELKDIEKLTNWVRLFLYIQIAVAVASLVSGVMEYQLLADFQSELYTSESKAIEAAEINDQRQRAIAIAYMLVFIVSAFLILKWIYRANYNARRLGAEGMEFTPGWAVGWYFVPIAALWKPYQAMKEIWKASHSPSNWKSASASAILPWWWFLWLVNGVLGQAVFRMSQTADELQELVTVNLVYQASDFVAIPLSLVMLSIVNSICDAQKKNAEIVS